MIDFFFNLVEEAGKESAKTGMTPGAWVMFFIGLVILGGGQIISLLVAFKKGRAKKGKENSASV
ncbi:MAG: MetS family NSS transporter small subunit [Planctomycetota bacterium]|nr:MetS family NSS transporter small subunit [Planctomycetota bacterium]